MRWATQFSRVLLCSFIDWLSSSLRWVIPVTPLGWLAFCYCASCWLARSMPAMTICGVKLEIMTTNWPRIPSRRPSLWVWCSPRNMSSSNLCVELVPFSLLLHLYSFIVFTEQSRRPNHYGHQGDRQEEEQRRYRCIGLWRTRFEGCHHTVYLKARLWHQGCRWDLGAIDRQAIQVYLVSNKPESMLQIKFWIDQNLQEVSVVEGYPLYFWFHYHIGAQRTLYEYWMNEWILSYIAKKFIQVLSTLSLSVSKRNLNRFTTR